MGNKFFFYTHKKSYILSLGDIVFLKAYGSYMTIVLAQGEEIKLSKNLNTILMKLGNPACMLKVHRSYCINIAFMDMIYYNDRRKLMALMKNKVEVPVSLYKMGQLELLVKERMNTGLTPDRNLPLSGNTTLTHPATIEMQETINETTALHEPASVCCVP